MILLPVSLSAGPAEIGTVIHSSGSTDIIAAACYNESCKRRENVIYSGDRIITMPSSKARILLNDGTGIEITGSSDFIIGNIRQKEKDPPSSIRAHYGTFTITQNNRFTDTSLTFKTETALIKSVNASLYIIAAKEETAVMVYRSRAGAASTDPSIKTAYILAEGEQTYILMDHSPDSPYKVDTLLRGSWLTKHHLSKDLSRIISRSQDSSIIDWIFRNRD